MAWDSAYLLPFYIPKQETYEPVYFTDDSVLSIPVVDSIPGLVTMTIEPEPRLLRPDRGDSIKDSNYDWITVLFLACVILITIAKNNFPKRITQLLKASITPRATAHLYRQGNPFTEQITLILVIIYLLTSSLFVFLILDNYFSLPDFDLRTEIFFALIVATNASYWLFKVILIKIIAYIFKTREASSAYLLNNLVFNMAIGLVLLISLPFVVYTGAETVLIVTLIFISIFLLYRVLRNVLVGLSITYFPLFYLMIFVFTVEIAPLLIIAKLFMNNLDRF
ncbi:MAG: DUF4271 domain-containing protein [Bacteroidales bacterium]